MQTSEAICQTEIDRPFPDKIIYTGHGTLGRAVELVDRANHRVAFMGMQLEARSHVTGPLVNAFVGAAQREAEVTVCYDSFSEHSKEGKLRIFPSVRPSSRQRDRFYEEGMEQMAELLDSAGVTRRVLNSYDSLLKKAIRVGWRAHDKLIVADGKALVGSQNWSDRCFSAADYMAEIDSPEVVDAIHRHIIERLAGKTTDDLVQVFDQGRTRLIFDAGLRFKSTILRCAIPLVHEAEKSDEIFLCSSHYPGGQLLKALDEKAKSGTPLTLVVPPPAREFPDSLLAHFAGSFWQSYLFKNGHVIFYPYRFHAKFLLIKNKIVMFGSHNFVRTGDRLATEEAEVETSVEKFVSAFDILRAQILEHAASLQVNNLSPKEYRRLIALPGKRAVISAAEYLPNS